MGMLCVKESTTFEWCLVRNGTLEQPGCGGGGRRPLACLSSANNQVLLDVREEAGALGGGSKWLMCSAS